MSIFASKNFRFSEFACGCGCGKDRPIDPKLIYLLQNLRDLINEPINISIGGAIRCKRYNKKIGGYVDSPHLYGKAVDIHNVNRLGRLGIIVFAKEAKKVGFPRIGLYPYNNFIHVDVVEPYPSASWVRTGEKPKEYKYTYFKTLEEAIEFIEKLS